MLRIPGTCASFSRSRAWMSHMVSFLSVLGVQVTERYAWVGPCTPPPPRECMPGSNPICVDSFASSGSARTIASTSSTTRSVSSSEEPEGVSIVMKLVPPSILGSSSMPLMRKVTSPPPSRTRVTTKTGVRCRSDTLSRLTYSSRKRSMRLFQGRTTRAAIASDLPVPLPAMAVRIGTRISATTSEDKKAMIRVAASGPHVLPINP